MTKNLRQKGFTILETLVAIAILGIAAASAISVAQKSLNAAIYAREEMTASYLAAEGIELVKNYKDSNILGGKSDWLGQTSGCPDTGNSGKKCYFDTTVASLALAKCTGASTGSSDECPTLELNNDGIYIPMTNVLSGNYIRDIYIRPAGGDPSMQHEAQVVVTVWWRNKTQKVTLVENIYKWF